ncbi:DUF2795 domain-containing protein [Halomonas sp. MCCC 1A17488]|uniref:DUF2795 domain-containing protein n=1 Tax=Billgrantia sulfidoxydans TaxID=2733484 RepID=A0ABX7W6U4_9GAMM|nr:MULTISPECIES: DUF2795 domain-containing protein [Halomonas]MCE8015542.1 DUF2795 domain-containing protein [Halomonas sp. MCCC 1A17488]MCG3238875.1 DUF2795 domain-containing protein [Halomonas sp. MCCC 1A17488]QPP51164.1 DUF2795 domain-containing protein [Halomonas sp. SS10-MC5]QTP54733.1 DUF2795 domain-containing protein [Halomonas sulfidoxydans]
MADHVEKGEIHFFYRPKVNTTTVQSLDDVQRLHVVLVPDDRETARLLLVGKKRLPEIVKGKPKSTAREWMMVDLTGKPKAIGEALAPLEYETRTRGEQEQGEAIPAGEGRYAIFERGNSSRLAYRLSRPGRPGKAQRELGILAEASFIISVRNPSLEVPGFPESKPNYPKRLQDKFADRRWIDVDDGRLLDYESVQLLLIGAHDDLGEEDVTISGKADLFRTLGLDRREWPTEALEGGDLARPHMQPESHAPAGDRSKGGERGGQAASSTASAAGIAQALKGVDFPCDKAALIHQAKTNRAAAEVIEVLNEFPRRRYDTMADVQRAVGELR